MQQIATKAKISLWCVVGDKEKIDFGLCDFSPDQVASLDRIVRAKDEPVRLTIEPEQKKLQIAPIEATVRIVSLACRSGGQRIKIADFKSPDSRAEAIKRMSAAETPLILTLEPTQNQLPFAEDEPRRSEPAGDDGPALSPDARSYVLKLKGLRKCSASLTVDRCDDGWDIWFCVGMGNYEIETEDGEITAPTRASVLEAARARMIDWLESLTMATQADRKRRLAMQQKINAEMGNIIEEAKHEDGEPQAD